MLSQFPALAQRNHVGCQTRPLPATQRRLGLRAMRLQRGCQAWPR